jgi:tRNA nucleotidyltransferase (CCA-adding enzyme)
MGTVQSFNFLAPEISQGDIATFAADKVNLRSEDAEIYREQVRNLREHLDRYIAENPNVGLAKMLLSGSLAKGTALRTINDADVALYVKGKSAPQDLASLLQWLVERLRTTYHQIPAHRIYIDDPCIVISFAGTGLDIEIAPILYLGEPDWRGYLWDRSSGKKILTSIPLHLDFIRRRKQAQPTDFAQIVRFVKWWIRQHEVDTYGFTMRSFAVELILAKLCDQGVQFEDYHSGLERFFTYVQNTGLKERISFTDNYSSSQLPAAGSAVVEIFDPVNPENNVADDMTELTRRKLVELADKTLDALGYARTAQTKADALECWREVMGASFSA